MGVDVVWRDPGVPSEWVPDEFVRQWLWHETGDQQLRFDAGFLVSNHHLKHGPVHSTQPVSVYTPLCVPQMATGGVVMGTLYGGRPQLSSLFPLETDFESRFCLDFRTGLLKVYLSHYPERSGLLELMQVDTDAVGDIITRGAVFEADNPTVLHFGYQTLEQKICAFCDARGMQCECPHRMRRSSLPDLRKALRQEYGVVSHARDFGMTSSVAASLVRRTMGFKYRAEVIVNGMKTPGNRLSKRYDIEMRGEVTEQARIRYAQALVAGRRPRALPSVESDGSRRGEPATNECDRASPAAESVDGLSCSLCGSCFTRKSDALRHSRTVHLRERHFSCPTCSRKFIHKTHLREHIDAVHKKVIAASCPECGKTFTSQSKANRHLMAVHNKIKLHACDVCGRSYAQRWALKRHAKSHLKDWT